MLFHSKISRFIFTLLLVINYLPLNSQSLNSLIISDQEGLIADSLTFSDTVIHSIKRKKAVLSFTSGEKIFRTGDSQASFSGNNYTQTFDNRIKLTLAADTSVSPGWGCRIEFENVSEDTITISNVIPFEADNESVYITGMGPRDLARAWLSRPGYRPVRVILPDNAWELGYNSFSVSEGLAICALTRRQDTDGGQKQRYQTILPPKAKVRYRMFTEVFRGEWQNGLRLMFRDRYLYDLEKFDQTLYQRKDLEWIKGSYLIILQMAWDREFYDRTTGKYTFPDLLRKGIDIFGNIDVFGIWPTWPRLGLDQRNQWDLYSDLPGGTAQLKNFSRLSRQNNTRFFIAYNPWDKSTRKEDHYKGMARLIKETEADGVVLDTQGSSSYELQAAADSVRKGVIMYSEGMAVTKDMPGIISGRVHNAIFYSPELNLNKLIKPDFSIFRVCDVGENLIHREIAIAFFNGYGTELNMFQPGGRDDNYRSDLEYLARTTFLLRQNKDAFIDMNWTPLLDTKADNIFVNRWGSGKKTIYTVLNMRPEGFEGGLFKSENDSGIHYVSLWNHENLKLIPGDGSGYVYSRTSGWPESYKGTRKEASLDCIASFPKLLRTELKSDSLNLYTDDNGRIIIWKGNPSYKTEFKEIKNTADTTIRVKDLFGYYEGKLVIQLLEGNILKDENIVDFRGGRPWLISRVNRTVVAAGLAPDMVLIPGAEFSFDVTPSDEFVPYPEVSGITVKVDSFLIDKYPVTNAQFYEFLQSSGYRPADTSRYLRHWEYDIYRDGQENYPVVYISYDDARAFAKWAGKRLPTQAEWQLAAQGTDKRKWPWGNEFHGTLCNNGFDKPTPVDAFSKGASQYGVMDLVGNIWQFTNDLYFNGSYYFTIIRGGSFFRPDSSWWYIQGGPQQLDKTQMMLLVSPGFDRSSTVGFRCVKDIDSRNFRMKR